MCGIAALIAGGRRNLHGDIESMVAALHHRGPDDVGVEVLAHANLAMGMRRLSILDIAGGHQPMWDEHRRHCVVFNGEIYNFAELRRDLVAAGHVFATDHSDTEVLVHGFEEWGPGVFARLNGMFAVAIWDEPNGRVVIGRDRAGEKPLYVARVQGGFAIASELKALLRLDDLARDLDTVALEQYLAFDYVIGPRTMLRDVQKLPAGNVGFVTPGSYWNEPYWLIDARPGRWDAGSARARLDELLEDSVRKRMVADVPVGLLLSGGVDSSTIGWYMSRLSDDVHSFSIGFEEEGFDESAYARAVAKQLGTKHHLEVFSQSKVRELVPRIPEILDEPMGDQSILPTYLLSEFTRRGVKVALGGDGSDELLMGYKAFQALKVAWSVGDRLPKSVRARLSQASREHAGQMRGPARRALRFASSLDCTPSQRLLAHLGSFKGDARWILSDRIKSTLPASVFTEPDARIAERFATKPPGAAEETIASYLVGYLQEDILVKVDRASMAASLEVRAPFLDPELIDFTLSLPASLKMPQFRRKDILRKLMRGRLPDEVLDRPKMGFGVPLAGWLRDALAPLLRETLSPDRVRARGIFDPPQVARLVSEHVEGRADHARMLWLLLQLELWQERWVAP